MRQPYPLWITQKNPPGEARSRILENHPSNANPS
jgi:hypothetical protein